MQCHTYCICNFILFVFGRCRSCMSHCTFHFAGVTISYFSFQKMPCCVHCFVYFILLIFHFFCFVLCTFHFWSVHITFSASYFCSGRCPGSSLATYIVQPKFLCEWWGNYYYYLFIPSFLPLMTAYVVCVPLSLLALLSSLVGEMLKNDWCWQNGAYCYLQNSWQMLKIQKMHKIFCLVTSSNLSWFWPLSMH